MLQLLIYGTMNVSVGVLRELLKGRRHVRELAELLDVSISQIYRVLRQLERYGIVTLEGGCVSYANSIEGLLARKVVSRYYRVDYLFRPRTIRLLSLLTEPRSAEELVRLSGYAEVTVYRNLSKLMQAGIVKKRGSEYKLVDDEDLQKLVNLLYHRNVLDGVEPGAILIYASNSFILKKAPRGVKLNGSLTAFSLFPQYGLNIYTSWDYYIYPPREISLEEILVHSLLAAETRYERTLTAVFYMVNKKRISFRRARRIARDTPVHKLLLELGNYIAGLPVENYDKFLPWDEFKELAERYGVNVQKSLHLGILQRYFRDIGMHLEENLTLYVFGGFNLLVYGVKIMTKDIDVIVEDIGSYRRLRNALLELGYTHIARREWTVEDKRATPRAIMVKDSLRVDIFTSKVNELKLTEKMKQRAGRALVYERLILKPLAIEDVILLKSVTSRERDIEDAAQIVRKMGVDWKRVHESLLEQGCEIAEKYALSLLETVEELEKVYGIKIPSRIKTRIEKLALKYAVKKALELGYRKPSEIKKIVDFSESKIRRVIKELEEGEMKSQ